MTAQNDGPERVEQIAADRGFELRDEPVLEGEAWRAAIARQAQSGGLLYVWEDSVLARRAARAHRAQHAAHLFAVPELLESGESWCLVEEIDGRTLSAHLSSRGAAALPDLGLEAARILVKGIGELTRKLHEIEVSREFGDILQEVDGAGGRWQTFSGYCAARLEHVSEALRRPDLDEETRSRLLTSIGDLRTELSAFHPRHAPSLTHQRLAPAHIWVDESGREVVGLTGFAHARLMPAEADLARLLWLEGIADDDALVRSFYEGYGAARTMDLQRRERFYRRLAAFEALIEPPERRKLSWGELVELTSP